MIAHRLTKASACLALAMVTACATTTATLPARTLAANRLSSFRIDTPPNGHGSGVVLSNVSDGAYILTCAHVVAGEKNVTLTVLDESGRTETVRATVAAFDADEDLAVIKVPRIFPRTVALDEPDGVRPGDEVYNVGYPFDYGEMVGRGSIMRVHYSGIAVTDDGPVIIRDTILADVPDGGGTSGSGVFDARTGVLVGIMEGIFAKGPYPYGLAPKMVIPIGRVRPFLDKHKIPYATAPPSRE
jgi:S1-C subfamily serine protease